MFWNSRFLLASSLAAGLLCAGLCAQDRRPVSRIDVEQYSIDAEISPNTSVLEAKVAVRFVPVDDGVTSAAFELNNALNVSRVTDEQGRQIQASRSLQDFSVRLNFDTPLPKGKPVTVTFQYDGKLSGKEDSPVYGITFASIQPDLAFLLYPARWFPVNGYTTDRFGANLHLTVPNGYSLLASGIDSRQTVGDKNVFDVRFERHSFPGSIALVKGQPAKVNSEGVTTTLYFRGENAAMADAYGQETGKIMSYFTGMFGLPPSANLTIVETDAGAPNGYAAPGLIFLAPRAIGKQTNSKLLANQIARQWWEMAVSPTTRNHLWLSNGAAAYAELLWLEHANGAGARDTQLHDVMVEALTIDTVPIKESARLEDYSPELWALTGAKGASVLNMLRHVVGDEKFFQILKTFLQRNAWKSASTEEFQKVAEAVSGQSLNYFFIQWIESSSAPEFKLEYTVFRTQKGFRVMGKISQDLDTFRMPVDLKIETEGNPEEKKVEVVGTSSEFSVDTFGKPKNIVIDPNNYVLRFSNQLRVAVAIRRGEQFAELSEFADALKEYQKALETARNSSLAHYRIAEVHFLQQTWQAAANEFREALNGDLEPKWTEVWARINLGKIFDVTGARDRALNEYNQALRTKDNTQGAQEEAAKYIKTPYERVRRPEP